MMSIIYKRKMCLYHYHLKVLNLNTCCVQIDLATTVQLGRVISIHRALTFSQKQCMSHLQKEIKINLNEFLLFYSNENKLFISFVCVYGFIENAFSFKSTIKVVVVDFRDCFEYIGNDTVFLYRICVYFILYSNTITTFWLLTGRMVTAN